jgi:amino acid transporter
MSHKLSLSSAIIINLNVMVGAGVFINTVLLSQNAGGLGAVAYAVVGILLLPLILTIYQLSKIHRGGNFYDYGLHLGPYGAFITTASYFIAKLASCSLAVHVSMSLLQTIFPFLGQFSTLMLDCLVISFFAYLNMMNLRTGKRIQYFFMGCKFVPILFVVLAGIYLFNPGHFNPEFLYPSGVITSVPFILYAFSGFEVSCSLSRSIENPEINGPRALLLAYTLGVGVVCFFQLLFYSSLGPIFDNLTSYLQAYPALLSLLSISPETYTLLKVVLHLGIACSALGAAYGIMFSNAWNLFELASKGHLFFADTFMRFNKHNIPVVCILAEAVIVMSYLLISGGKQVTLQQMSAFGSALAYTCCALALISIVYRTSRAKLLIPVLGLASCFLLLGSLVNSALVYGVLPITAFMLILLLMSVMFRSKNRLA